MAEITSGFVMQQPKAVYDCRNEEILLGCKLVVERDGELVERTAVWIAWLEDGWVVRFEDGDCASPEKCAVVGPVLTPGTIPEDASLVILRTDEILPRQTLEQVKHLAELHLERKVVVMSGLDWPVEWWTDEMLASVGLQRV